MEVAQPALELPLGPMYTCMGISLLLQEAGHATVMDKHSMFLSQVRHVTACSCRRSKTQHSKFVPLVR